MDGLLVVDKPAGPTSHDVVDRLRRALHESRIGHTGTLDPLATGVLPLVLGRATRLARFLSGSDKTYEAVVCLGARTDTGDSQGQPIGSRHDGPLPGSMEIDRALDAFRGSFMQRPPAFSAKKVEGRRSYRLARALRKAPALAASIADLAPSPVPVTVHRLEILAFAGDLLTLRVDCAAGFYMRALADDLGTCLGTGAHLGALRRIRVGEYTLKDAVDLESVERNPSRAEARVLPPHRLLETLPKVVLTRDGVKRAIQGQELRAHDVASGSWSPASPEREGGRGPEGHLGPEGQVEYVRLVDQFGGLVGIGRPLPGRELLHPAVVLR